MYPLDGPRRKLDRAAEHIQTLNDAVRRFYDSEPLHRSGQFNAEQTAYIYRFEVDAIPIYIGIVASDVLHNLRSALDHITWQLALITAHAENRVPYRLTAFPIFLKDDDLARREIKRLLQDVPNDARDIIESLQPYNTPQSFRPEVNGLWLLHQLSNADKHQVITIGAAMLEIAFRAGMSEDWSNEYTVEITVPVVDKNLPPSPPKVAYYLVLGRGIIGNGARVEALSAIEKYIREGVLPKFERFFP